MEPAARWGASARARGSRSASRAARQQARPCPWSVRPEASEPDAGPAAGRPCAVPEPWRGPWGPARPGVAGSGGPRSKRRQEAGQARAGPWAPLPRRPVAGSGRRGLPPEFPAGRSGAGRGPRHGTTGGSTGPVPYVRRVRRAALLRPERPAPSPGGSGRWPDQTGPAGPGRSPPPCARRQ